MTLLALIVDDEAPARGELRHLLTGIDGIEVAGEAASAREALVRVGLGDRLDVPSMELSHGEHRQLEIAMAFVTRPKLMLLDEPAAGMGPEESQRMVSLLRELKNDHAILLIEHDMDVVFAIADRITVLVNGRVIASGDPAAIEADASVREAYLGDDVGAH